MSRTATPAAARSGSRLLGRSAAFAIVAYAFAVTMLGPTLPTPLYPLYERQLGLSQLVVTVIFAVYTLGVVLGLLLFGRLSDAIGRKPVLLPGLGLSALSAVLFLVAHSTALLYPGRVLSGLSVGLFTGTATATLLDLGRDGARERSALVATVANLGGLGLGSVLAGLVSEPGRDPLRLPFVTDLALIGLAFVLVALIPGRLLPSTRARPAPRRLRIPPEVRPVFVPSAITGFVGLAVLGLYSAVSPGFMTHLLGIHDRAAIGAVASSAFLASLIGQTLLEWLLRPVALVAGCALVIAGMGILVLALATSSLAALVGAAIVSGSGVGLSFRAALAAVAQAAPVERRGEVSSAFFVTAYSALAVPVIGTGILAEASSLRLAGIAFAAAMAAIVAIVVVLLSRTTPVVAQGATSSKARDAS